MGCMGSKTKVIQTGNADDDPKAEHENNNSKDAARPVASVSPNQSSNKVVVAPADADKPPLSPARAFAEENVPLNETTSSKKASQSAIKQPEPAATPSQPAAQSQSPTSPQAAQAVPSPDQAQEKAKEKEKDADKERDKAHPAAATKTQAAEPSAPSSTTSTSKPANKRPPLSGLKPLEQKQPLPPTGQQSKSLAVPMLPGALPQGSPGAAAPATTRKGMFEIVQIDEDAFKSTGAKNGGRVPLPLQSRLNRARAQTPLDAATLQQKMKHAEEKREEEREKRRKAAAEDVHRVDECRETIAEREERKAAELRKMIQSKTKVAENNRESTIDVVRMKKEGRHKEIKKAAHRAKADPNKASLLGDLPPIGKCLLAPDVPTNEEAKPPPSQHPYLPMPTAGGAVSPRTPASISGLISPVAGVHSPTDNSRPPQPADIAKAVEAAGS